MKQGCHKNCELYRLETTRIRSAIRRRAERLTERVKQSETVIAELQQRVRDLRQRLDHAEQEREFARAQLLQQQQSADESALVSAFAQERPLAGHQFCVRLIALGIELGQRVGFRAASDVLKTVFNALRIKQKVPSHDAIEQWMLRLGVSSLQDTFTKDQRVLWMADHSVQVGSEKVLLIIGAALDDLPPAGETMDFDKVKVLAVLPGTTWKTEDVAREYRNLADQIGVPVYLLCDGARELRDAAEVLEKDGQKTIVLGDLKHHAANVLEKEIGNSERFKSFVREVGLTRNRVQQTELSHFAPRKLRQKSRFMNLGPLLQWAAMVLHHLDHPKSDARQGVSVERMEAKLGWLRAYAEDVAEWGRCQEVIHRSLDVINRHGLDGATAASVDAELQELDVGWRDRDTPASRIGRRLVEWIEASAGRLHEGDRAWISTEILESLFGRFKQLERQHSKGGFTRLIGALPTLCMTVSGDIVREAFGRLNSPQLCQWLADHVGTTLTSRRNAAYREHRKQLKDHVVAPT